VSPKQTVSSYSRQRHILIKWSDCRQHIAGRITGLLGLFRGAEFGRQCLENWTTNKVRELSNPAKLLGQLNNYKLLKRTQYQIAKALVMGCGSRSMEHTRWFKYGRDCLCVNKSQFIPVIFEPPCICQRYAANKHRNKMTRNTSATKRKQKPSEGK
jgi:hypothetical protein